jgi:hypothetical protein
MPDPFQDITQISPPLDDEVWDHGVLEIEWAASQSFNRSSSPVDEELYWYIDDLGQTWCEFVFLHHGEPAIKLIPANRVVHITFKMEAVEGG